MVGFWKNPFGKSSAKTPAPFTLPDVENMPFDQLVSLTQGLPDNIAVRDSIAIMRRFRDIAYQDHHVPNERRLEALRLSETLKETLETTLAAHPDQLDAFHKAQAFTDEQNRRFGIGSLSWRLTEENVSNADTIPFVMRREHGHLVADLLLVLNPEALAGMRPHLVRELVQSRLFPGSTNAVLTLHALATQADKAALAIFTPAEVSALVNVPNNYGAGRKILVGLNLLLASEAPPSVTVSSLRAAMPRRAIAELHRCSGESEAEIQPSEYPEEYQTALLTALLILRVCLARQILSQFIGQQYSDEMMIIFRTETKDELEYFDECIRILSEMKEGAPIDFMFFYEMMAYGGIEPKSEDEYNEKQALMSSAAYKIGAERVKFLEALLSLFGTAEQPYLSMDALS